MCTRCVTSSCLRLTEIPTVGWRSSGKVFLMRWGGWSINAPSTIAGLLSRSTETEDRAERKTSVLPRDWLPQHRWIWGRTGIRISGNAETQSRTLKSFLIIVFFFPPVNEVAETGMSAGPACCCGCAQRRAPAQSQGLAGCGMARWWCHCPVKCSRRRTLSPLPTVSSCWGSAATGGIHRSI